MSFADEMQKLADHIAKKAIEDATPLAEKLDALGKLTTYYGLVLKRQLRDADDADEITMGGVQAVLRRVEEQDDDAGQRGAAPAVPVRTRRRPHPDH